MAKRKIDISNEVSDIDQVKFDGSIHGKPTKELEMKKEEILSMSQRRAHMRRRRRIIIGGVMCIFMLIGVITIISTGVGFGKMLLDNTAEKERYNNLLLTLVVADPLPFESVDLADPALLLSSSIWAAVMNEDMEQYEKSEFSQTYLPAVDVDNYFSKVFGTQNKLTHQSFQDQGIDFEFNEEKQAYVIPVTSFPTGFSPKVEKIKSSFTEKIVTVGYISPAISWSDTSDGTISKYVDFIFQKQDKSFYLVAVRESEMKVKPVQTELKSAKK